MLKCANTQTWGGCTLRHAKGYPWVYTCQFHGHVEDQEATLQRGGVPCQSDGTLDRGVLARSSMLIRALPLKFFFFLFFSLPIFSLSSNCEFGEDRERKQRLKEREREIEFEENLSFAMQFQLRQGNHYNEYFTLVCPIRRFG